MGGRARKADESAGWGWSGEAAAAAVTAARAGRGRQDRADLAARYPTRVGGCHRSDRSVAAAASGVSTLLMPMFFADNARLCGTHEAAPKSNQQRALVRPPDRKQNSVGRACWPAAARRCLLRVSRQCERSRVVGAYSCTPERILRGAPQPDPHLPCVSVLLLAPTAQSFHSLSLSLVPLHYTSTKHTRTPRPNKPSAPLVLPRFLCRRQLNNWIFSAPPSWEGARNPLNS
jgi:hypothetical protein